MKFKFTNKKHVFVQTDKDKIEIFNHSKEDYWVDETEFRGNFSRKQLQITFNAEIIEGKACTAYLLNRKREILRPLLADETQYVSVAPRIFSFRYCVPAKTHCIIKTIEAKKIEDYTDDIKNFFTEKTILISPGYPSKNNKYFWAFVHSRVKEYAKSGLKMNVAVPSYTNDMSISRFEGINVCKLSWFDMRELLQTKDFSNIIIHFFSDEVANILSSISISEKNIYIYCHSADLLYRDLNKLSTRYFDEVSPVSTDQKKYFETKDKLVRRFNNRKNVKFVFGTKWALNTSQEENKITYTNSTVIPCPIDEDNFEYIKRDPEKRKNIVIVRKFDNINTYGIDINVKCILELSKRDFFNDLTFNIYGEGDYHKVLLAPLKQFDNVHIHNHYLSHEEMQKIYSENGIALFGTRYETQGVAAAEAAMSGLVVITNNVAAVSNVFNEDMLCAPEDYKGMADRCEYYYRNPMAYLADSEKMHNCVLRTCSSKQSLKKDLEIFEEIASVEKKTTYPRPSENIVLSVVVPSYNAQQWLKHGVETVISSKYADKIEVLVINDGSKDATGKIGAELERKTTVDGKSIVRLINKENGGHGSTINVGIKEAKGKYLKMMDADDYYDTEALDKLIPLLENETSDIVLTDYVEDWSTTARFIPQLNYSFMEPGKKYDIEELCYEGYGFNRYANILHTSTYRTEMLRNGNFSISEHCFYVDMEMNTFSFMLAKTITYYPLQLYIYYLGRKGQSVSPEAFKRNYQQHEHVLMKILSVISKSDISYGKKTCLYRTIILPMVETQYYICTEYLDDGKAFMEFDNEMRKYEEIYHHPFIENERVKYHRATNGRRIGK